MKDKYKIKEQLISESVEMMQRITEGDHLCCIYDTEEKHQAVLTPFLRYGLEQGEKVVYIVDAHTAETVLGYLRDDGLDIEPYLASGQLSILTVNDAYMRERVFDPDRMISLLRAETERASTEGYSALRVTGEMTWALQGLPGSKRLIEYEVKLNEFFPDSKCLAICQYDQRRFDPSVLLEVLRTHPSVIVGTVLYDNFYYIPPSELLGHDLPTAKLRHWLQNLAENKRIKKALQYRVDLEKLITSLSTHFINLTPGKIDRGVNKGLQAIGEFVGVDRSYVFQFSDNGMKMDMIYEWCDEGIEPLIQIHKGLLVNDFPWQIEKIKRRETIHIPRVADLPSEASSLKEDLQSQEVQSLIQVPMIFGESIVGFTGFDSQRSEKTWPEDIIALLRIVGEIFSNALERMQKEEEIQQRTEDLNLLNLLNSAINQGDSLQEIFQLLSKEIKKIFSCYPATVYLISKDKKYFVMQNLTLPPAVVNRIEKLIGIKIPAIEVPLKAGSLYLKALQEDKHQLINDPVTIKRLMREFTETVHLPDKRLRKALQKLIPQIYKVLGIQSVINVPLVLEGEAIGLLDVSRKEPFTESDLRRLGFISGHLTAIVKHKYAEEATKLAYAELSQIFETAADGMRVIDKDFNIIRANETFLALLGLSEDEVLGKKCYEVFGDPLCHTPNCPLTRILGGEERVEYEKEKEGEDGIRIPCFLTATAYRGTNGELVGIIEDFKDITERIQAQNELKQSFERLQRTFEGTINTLGLVIEIRDPYTAGHQRRVTQLACAIAKEMGFTENQIEGLRMAGLIHDIGKINIPAEILSKPGRLSDIEFNLVKTHAEFGHNILKTIEYPWPVAQIVLQHHERMDGSGYSQGLSDEGILMEARILGVSDVVEAMASHRPYRPALGIDKALDEISQNRGVLYDPDVADACLKIFTEKRFKFE